MPATRPRPTRRRRALELYEPRELVVLILRQTPLMLITFLVVAGLGVAFAFTLQKSWQAHSSLIVRLGQEYVYEPRVGDAARGSIPEPDQVVQSESEILSSAALKQRVIRRLGLARIDPALGRRYAAATPAGRELAEGAAVREMERSLKISTAPGTSVVRLDYTAADPETAALVLNALVDEYLVYRHRVLSARDVRALSDQRQVFQQRLDAADAAYTRFLADNGVADFDSEKASLAQLYGQLLADRANVEVQLSEAQGRLAATEQSLASAPPEVGLYRDLDHTASDKLMQLRVERQDLLSRYQPTAQPVRDIDAKIAAVQAEAARAQGATAAQRVGANPVYETLLTEKHQTSAQAASLRSRREAIAAQLAQIASRRQKLAELEPRYQDLMRQREVLAANVKALDARQQESEAAQALAQKSDDNVRVVERATPSTQAKSLRGPVAVLSVLFAAFSALCMGAVAALLRGGYPSARAVQQALDLPVLGAAPPKPARA